MYPLQTLTKHQFDRLPIPLSNEQVAVLHFLRIRIFRGGVVEKNMQIK